MRSALVLLAVLVPTFALSIRRGISAPDYGQHDIPEYAPDSSNSISLSSTTTSVDAVSTQTVGSYTPSAVPTTSTDSTATYTTATYTIDSGANRNGIPAPDYTAKPSPASQGKRNLRHRRANPHAVLGFTRGVTDVPQQFRRDTTTDDGAQRNDVLHNKGHIRKIPEVPKPAPTTTGKVVKKVEGSATVPREAFEVKRMIPIHFEGEEDGDENEDRKMKRVQVQVPVVKKGKSKTNLKAKDVEYPPRAHERVQGVQKKLRGIDGPKRANVQRFEPLHLDASDARDVSNSTDAA